MNTKLTLTIDKEAIDKAKFYANKHGRSLSDIVESYFLLLTQKQITSSIGTKTKTLKGIIKVDSNFDYKKELEAAIIEKHMGK